MREIQGLPMSSSTTLMLPRLGAMMGCPPGNIWCVVVVVGSGGDKAARERGGKKEKKKKKGTKEKMEPAGEDRTRRAIRQSLQE